MVSVSVVNEAPPAALFSVVVVVCFIIHFTALDSVADAKEKSTGPFEVG